MKYLDYPLQTADLAGLGLGSHCLNSKATEGNSSVGEHLMTLPMLPLN